MHRRLRIKNLVLVMLLGMTLIGTVHARGERQTSWWRTTATKSAPSKPAVAVKTAAVAAAPSRTDLSSLTFQRILGSDSPVKISGTQGELRLGLPIPASSQVTEAQLELVGTVSEALAQGSQLVVEVNGEVLQQIRLNGLQNKLRINVPIPISALRSPSNEVKLSFAQHYTEKCEDPTAAQLWSQIDVRASRFLMRFSPQPVTSRLDRLNTLFDKATWEQQPVIPLLSAGASNPEITAAMGLVAQGVGQRYEYVPVKLTHGRLPLDPAAVTHQIPAQAKGAIAMGTFKELEGLLTDTTFPRSGPPVVAIRAMPNSPERFLLIFAAQSHAELRMAATAFALPRFPWSGASWTAISELGLPSSTKVSDIDQSTYSLTNAAPLSALGYKTSTSSGMNAAPARVRFWNPAWQGRIQVRVHANYAAGMSPRSALNVLANGVLQGSIPLNNAAGGEYNNYAVTVPAGALAPGWNTLEIQPLLIPSDAGGECKPIIPGNLSATIHDNTTIQTIGGSPLREPELSLLAKEGRVVPGAPNDQAMAIQLTDDGPATVGAGLTLMAKLSQVFKGPLLHAKFQTGTARDTENVFWIGAIDKLPPEVRKAIGAGTSGSMLASIPVVQSMAVPVMDGGGGLQPISEGVNSAAMVPTTLKAKVGWTHPAVPGGIASTAMVSGEPTTVITAGTPALLEDAMAALVDHGPWGQLKGNLAMWTPGDPAMRTISADDAPFVSYSLRGALGLWVSQFRWLALIILLVGLSLLVWLTRKVLVYYRTKNLPPQSTPVVK